MSSVERMESSLVTLRRAALFNNSFAGRKGLLVD
jgi:hypothetical protein